MSSRLLRWMVLGFTCLWFGVLLPVHQRGQIQLPGAAPRVAGPSCCNHSDASRHRSTHDGKQQPAKPSNPENCAVCHFIAGLDVPPPVTWYVERQGLVESVPAEQHVAVPHRAEILPFHGRAPPVV